MSHENELLKEKVHLQNEIDKLAQWFLAHNYLIREGSAVDNAIRLLNEYMEGEDLSSQYDFSLDFNVTEEEYGETFNTVEALADEVIDEIRVKKQSEKEIADMLSTYHDVDGYKEIEKMLAEQERE